MVMFGAAGVKSRRAFRAGISAAKILCNRRRLVTGAAENRTRFMFVPAPNLGLMACDFLVTVDTGKKRIAAFEPDGDNITFRSVVRALITIGNADPAHNYRFFPFLWKHSATTLITQRLRISTHEKIRSATAKQTARSGTGRLATDGARRAPEGKSGS
jgi:hypothetical protein